MLLNVLVGVSCGIALRIFYLHGWRIFPRSPNLTRRGPAKDPAPPGRVG